MVDIISMLYNKMWNIPAKLDTYSYVKNDGTNSASPQHREDSDGTQTEDDSTARMTADKN